MLVSLKELAEELGAGVLCSDPADVSRQIADVATLETAGGAHLAYVDSDKHLPKLAGCRAAAVLVNTPLASRAQSHFQGPLLTVENARDTFIIAMLRFRPAPLRKLIGVSPAAIVRETARVGSGTNVHPGACIGERAVIGRDCDIHPGVVIGDGCLIGDGVILYPNVVLYRDVRIGDRVIVHAGAVLGADGFGYRLVHGEYVKIPHTGTVILEDDVEIGANATIDRAMVGATVIGSGTKIDNLVMIGHNCEIGRHNAFASQVGFAGSVKTGDYVRCAGQAGLADHLHLGDRCTVGPQAGVHADIPAGLKVHGSPALPDKEQIRLVLTLQKLPQMYRDVQALLKQVAALESRVGEKVSGESVSGAGATDAGSANTHRSAA